MNVKTNTATAVKTSPPATKFLLKEQQALSKIQFKRISSFMQRTTGIKLPESKLTMIQARLANRLKALNFENYDQYVNYVFSSDKTSSDEIIMMIDLITTNLTHFFREETHFDFLSNSVLPYLAENNITVPEIWSAGCSSGEEPYTLSIVLSEFIKKNPGKFSDYKILATDISTKILSKAVEAVYPLESIEKIPYKIKHEYFLKSKNPDMQLAKVKPAIRNKVTFERLNFMDSFYRVKNKKDIIFCRNVLIYFDKPTQLAVIKKLVDCLKPGGFLFLGHSETIFGSNLPLKTVSTTVFQKTKEL
ncbi:MAG: protein-glutamate O-methyltransferase CheR [Treponema sp.]|uniref:CheR family methyltransferase n=1 Tax=Treponema sp. TaxID=166 RepID=UPI001B44036E|nr:protein-glutamate O-methyltransferase CheR [Treponema sp.]MBP5402558.1 protein-glutamate O-methyltransferase CheR [Treponema sp.]MBR5933857.1 protein-glutamate O-methyltransferase CheR [Treponema sp.]